MTIATYEQPHELATIEPGQNLITWARALGSAHQIATALCTTSFVPRHFAGKPEEAAAALMLGDELGLAPVSALRSIFVIGGTPGMYAKTMVALVQSRGHEVWTEAESATKVTVCGRRAGSDKVERSEWTIERARRAGYTSNKKYEQAPEDMLYARAAATVCRRIAADVLTGIPYAVEELELEDGNKPAKTVRRAKAKPTTPEPELDAPAAEAPKATQPDRAEPPLDDDLLLDTRSDLAKAMYASINEAGITEDERLPYIASVIGRDITSSKEMTEGDARKVLRALDETPDVTDAEIVDADA